VEEKVYLWCGSNTGALPSVDLLVAGFRFFNNLARMAGPVQTKSDLSRLRDIVHIARYPALACTFVLGGLSAEHMATKGELREHRAFLLPLPGPRSRGDQGPPLQDPDPAGISHGAPAAAPYLPAPAALRSARVLDVLSSTPVRPVGRVPCIHGHPGRLATDPGEKRGLGCLRPLDQTVDLVPQKAPARKDGRGRGGGVPVASRDATQRGSEHAESGA